MNDEALGDGRNGGKKVLDFGGKKLKALNIIMHTVRIRTQPTTNRRDRTHCYVVLITTICLVHPFVLSGWKLPSPSLNRR